MKITVDIKPNAGSIAKKVESYFTSGKGRDRIQDTVNKYIDNDVRRTQAGSRVITLQFMRECAHELCSMINANAAALPASVYAHVQSINVQGVFREDSGAIRAHISFTDTSMERPSLVPEVYGFVDNIVVLFEKGWHANAPVYGEWHGQKVGSRTDYPGDNFIHSAVDSFNGKYGGLGIRATITSVYA